MSWSTVRDGVKRRLDTISGLSARDTAPTNLPDRDTATVLPSDPVLAPSGHRGKTDIRFTVAVRCVRGKLEDSQDALDAYIWPNGTNSITKALYAAPTLPVSVSGVETATVDDVEWLGVSGYGGVEGTQGVQANVNFLAKVTA